MPSVQPTTVQQMEPSHRTPCCDAPLVLSSPPNVYECRECMERYDLSEDTEKDESETEPSEEPATCTVELTTGDRAGEICGRDRPCRFHS